MASLEQVRDTALLTWYIPRKLDVELVTNRWAVSPEKQHELALLLGNLVILPNRQPRPQGRSTARFNEVSGEVAVHFPDPDDARLRLSLDANNHIEGHHPRWEVVGIGSQLGVLAVARTVEGGGIEVELAPLSDETYQAVVSALQRRP